MVPVFNIVFYLLFLKLCVVKCYEQNIKIWGPGLEPHVIVMPARYFFIDIRNSSLIKDPGIKDDLQIKIDGENPIKGTKCRIYQNILDRKDGTFIVRFKLFDECHINKIMVTLKNEHIGNSPYEINDIAYPDECKCPKRNFNEILKLWKCDSLPPSIEHQFEKFLKIDWELTREKVIKTFHKPRSVSLCHYVVKNSRIYRRCYGEHVGFNMFVDSILNFLNRRVLLPDLEFFVNLGDWPLMNSHASEVFPIFSWCGSDSTEDIIMPTYDITESSLENMGRVTLDMLSVQGNTDLPWERRKSQLFWRGRDSNQYRLRLIEIARENPHLFNASLTNFFFFRDKEPIYGPKEKHISFFKFFDYKYQLAIDGTVAPYRTPYLLAGGSLIFKPHSKYFEYFYPDLEPNFHYIPVETDLSDLVDKIKWAMENDDAAQKIAKNAQTYAIENLLPKNIFCYHMHLLNELHKRIASPVNVLDEMDEVTDPKAQHCSCNKEFENMLKDLEHSTKEEL